MKFPLPDGQSLEEYLLNSPQDDKPRGNANQSLNPINMVKKKHASIPIDNSQVTGGHFVNNRNEAKHVDALNTNNPNLPARPKQPDYIHRHHSFHVGTYLWDHEPVPGQKTKDLPESKNLQLD